MTAKRKHRPIVLPSVDEEESSETASQAASAPTRNSSQRGMKKAAAKTAAEATWVEEGQPASGIIQDAAHPARFHRKGRGNRPRRTVRRLTVYVEDELATQLDVFRARADVSLSRSDVMEAALHDYLKRNS